VIPPDVRYVVVKRVKRAVEEVLDLYAWGSLRSEDQITGALVALLHHHLTRVPVEGLRIEVFAVGPRSEEPRIGADLGIVVSVDFPNFKQCKLLLAQAKRCECERRFRLRDGNVEKALLDQCRKMLGVTYASYVLVYTRSELCGFLAYRAADVLSLEGVAISCRALSELWATPLPELFDDLLKCKVGDTEIVQRALEGGVERMVLGRDDLERLEERLEERGCGARHLLAILLRRAPTE